MEVILVSRARGRTWRLNFERSNVLNCSAAVSLVLAILGSGFAAGYFARSGNGGLPDHLISSWQKDFNSQREALRQTRADADENAHALGRRIASLDASILRLDAVGSRMTQIAHIDPGEFRFDRPPPMGGPDLAAPLQPQVLGTVENSLDQLEARLDQREREMSVLEDILSSTHLAQQVQPSGWPIASGYMTSAYGSRTDPFTGMYSFHPGIDFSSAEGSSVLAVATGIVTEVGSRDGFDGYGQMVEINHGNGYVTRYAHNERILVKVGDRVVRGQPIARMGNTGRSTGPHVHFEVLLNGQTVNPERYIEAAR